MKVSKKGYKQNSPDKNEKQLLIMSGKITMKGVNYPVLGTDNLGNQIMMMPGQDYEFPGSSVVEQKMQQGGEPDLIKKYGTYVDKRSDWLKKVKQPIDYSESKDPFYKISTKIAKQYGLDPATFAASFYEEGAAEKFYPDKKGTIFFSGDEDFPVAGYEGLGVDNFSTRFKEFVKNGYLKPEFKDRFKPYETTNEHGRKIFSADFKTMEDALTAKGAFLAAERDQFNKYTKEKKLTLSDKAQQFFGLAAYNAGQTGAREMFKYFQDNNLLEGDKFLTQKPEKYQGVYDNVMHRIQGAAMLKGETGVFKKGGWIKGAVNPEHKGFCTPMTKETCTPRRKAFAKRAKAHFKQDGGDDIPKLKRDTSPAELIPNTFRPITPEQNNLPFSTTPGQLVPGKQPKDFNTLPFLNMFNFGLSKWAEGLQNKDQRDYDRQMVLLQNQPATYTPEGQFQYGDPRASQMGGAIPQDVSYMAPVFDMPTFGGAGAQAMQPEPEPIPVPTISKKGKIEKGQFAGVQADVAEATQEILNMFPKLKVTSTVRSWGDKDAHPKGRAADVAGDYKTLAEAWKYYKDNVVMKYGFNQALPLNHGTGPHIHVGYYQFGGEYNLSESQIQDLEKQGYKFQTL